MARPRSRFWTKIKPRQAISVMENQVFDWALFCSTLVLLLLLQLPSPLPSRAGAPTASRNVLPPLATVAFPAVDATVLPSPETERLGVGPKLL